MCTRELRWKLIDRITNNNNNISTNNWVKNENQNCVETKQRAVWPLAIAIAKAMHVVKEGEMF